MRPSTPVERASQSVEREAPPRIPVTDQRLIRITAVAALAGVLLSALLLMNINPSVDPIAGLAASLAFGCTLALATAPILLVESYRRHPGQWRGGDGARCAAALSLGRSLAGIAPSAWSGSAARAAS